MRILAIQLCNLNSLQGDHAIHFDQPPLSQAGIFAITGPTGAGKTTILDAITLALYGRAARYDRATPSEVMSRHTGECFAEVHFECRGHRYGARWELRRARGKPSGALQSPKRLVYDLDSKKALVSKVKEADEWITQSTGLDYQRFLRSVLLAQGDFTAFLKATDKERGQLLEKLTGMEIYTELSRLAHEITRDKRQTLAHQRSRLETIELLSPEALKEKSDDLTEKRKMLHQALASLEKRRQVEACLNAWEDLGKKRETHRQARELHEKEVASSTEWRRRLQRHRQVEAQAPAITSWQDLHRHHLDLQKKNADLQERSQSLMAATSRAAEAVTLARREHAETERAFTQLGRLLEEVAPLDRERDLKREQLADYQKRATQLEADLAPVRRKLAQDTAALHTWRQRTAEVQTWLDAHRPDLALLDNLPSWERQWEQWQEFDAQTMEAQRLLKSHTSRLQERQDTVVDLQKRQSTLSASVSRAQDKMDSLVRQEQSLLQNQPLAHWEDQRRRLSDQRFLFQTILTKSRQAQQLEDRRKILDTLRHDHQTQLKKLTDELAHAVVRRQHAEETWQLKRELILRGQEIRTLRQALQPGQPCHVCGAIDHPWAHQPQADDREESELAALEDQRRHTLQTESALRQEEVRLKTHLAQLQNELSENAESQRSLSEEVADLQDNSPSALPCHQLEAIEKRAAELESQQIQEDQRLAQARAIRQQLEQARRTLDEERLQAQKITQDLAKLTGQHEELLTQQRQAQQAVTRSRQKADDALANLLKNILPTLTPEERNPPPDPAALEHHFQTLKNRALNLQRHLDEQATLHNQGIQIDSRLETGRAEEKQLQRSLADANSRITDITSNLKDLDDKRFQLAGKRDLIAERAPLQTLLDERSRTLSNREATHRDVAQQAETTRSLQADVAREAKTCQEKCQHAERALAKHAQELGFTNLADLVAAYLPPEEARVLEDRDQHLKHQSVRLESEASQLQHSQEELQRRYHLAAPDNPPIDTLDPVAWKNDTQTEEASCENLKRAVWDLEHALKTDGQRRRELDASLKTLQDDERTLTRWQQLDALIGSSDGSHFSRFAQSLTLKRLVSLANRHLLSLTDRYQIQCVDGADLEIEVVDRYQANAVRSMQSLSGGEGFLASLALALGLAELAGGHGNIESLFIDEGFGTLDADSLEIAIRALENLRSQNKTIGIISHTELLKERISCQIQVSRGRAGVSRLQTVHL